MRLTVLGAAGRTGEGVLTRALDAGHAVTAVDIERPDVPGGLAGDLRVIEGSETELPVVREAVADADAVIHVAGHTDAAPDRVLSLGAKQTVAAMDAEGVDRLVTLASTAVRTDKDPSWIHGTLARALLRVIDAEALRDADAHVRHVTGSDLDWTVLRAPQLGSREATGSYRLGYEAVSPLHEIPRGDVAAALIDVVDGDRWVGELPVVAPGE